MRFWQIAAGMGPRHYSNLCLRLGVILNGPGWAGAWPECKTSLTSSTSGRKIADIRRFAEEIQDGDVVVLRVGKRLVYGVGLVYGSYQHKQLFSDVDGWDLQHVRRVKWLWKAPREHPKDFESSVLNFGDTTQELKSHVVREWAETFIGMPEESLPDLPEAGKQLSPDELVQSLYDYGFGVDPVNETTVRIAELVRLARWYNQFGEPSESETVSHVVVPLLRALGWSAQRTAVGWGQRKAAKQQFIDVGLFGRVPRSEHTLSVVVEVKSMSDSIWGAQDQAFDYAKELSQNYCRRVIVTNGFRYGVYLRDNDGAFSTQPAAYLNLAAPQSSYPLWNCAGADKALLLMSADWTPDAAGPGPAHVSPTMPESV